ncbi:MAG: hypothetical protein ACRD0J_15340 [Acidimicrobiales bacterium]
MSRLARLGGLRHLEERAARIRLAMARRTWDVALASIGPMSVPHPRPGLPLTGFLAEEENDRWAWAVVQAQQLRADQAETAYREAIVSWSEKARAAKSVDRLVEMEKARARSARHKAEQRVLDDIGTEAWVRSHS